MDQRIKDLLLLPIIKAVMNEMKPPSDICSLHHVQVGKKTLYFNDDDVLFLYNILHQMVNDKDLKKRNSIN